MRNGEKVHIPCRQVDLLTDKLIQVQSNGEYELVDILEVNHKDIPLNEFVWVGTESQTIIANGLLASTINEDDHSDLWQPAAKKAVKSPAGKKLL